MFSLEKIACNKYTVVGPIIRIAIIIAIAIIRIIRIIRIIII